MRPKDGAMTIRDVRSVGMIAASCVESEGQMRSSGFDKAPKLRMTAVNMGANTFHSSLALAVPLIASLSSKVISCLDTPVIRCGTFYGIAF